jgi:hypothetical protein
MLYEGMIFLAFGKGMNMIRDRTKRATTEATIAYFSY